MADNSESLHDIFASKYDNPDSDWGSHGSGPGSDPHYNLPYRISLESFFTYNNIRSVLDIGCGDWQFSRFLRLDGIQYTGLDIVQSLVRRNNEAFGGPNVRFDLMPTDKTATPPADLLIMKDVLQHQDNAGIMDFYDKVVPRYQHCLITNSYRKIHTPTNVDTGTGGFRCLDLRSEPYFWRGSYVLQFTTGVWEEVRTLLIQNQR